MPFRASACGSATCGCAWCSGRFLPGAPGATALRELLTLLSGVSLEYEIGIVLRAEAVQTSSLA